MYNGQLVFSQIMECVPHWDFQRLVRRYPPSGRRLFFSPWEHFLAMSFAQLTFRESLRDVAACLGGRSTLAYHLGFRHQVTRSTLAHANEHRDWRLFAAVAQRLMGRARLLYQDEPGVLDVAAQVYALDSSIIDLSFALCPWANWTGTDAAVKLHTLLDLRGPLPAFVAVTAGQTADVTLLDELPVEPGSFYIMDRGYLDLRRLGRLAEAGAFFVIRERSDLRYYVAGSRPVDRSGGLRCDQTIRFCGTDSRRWWPQPLRRVTLFDSERKRRLAFWTNQWALPASTIAALYRQRWQVELFFRWIKQNLRLRAFYGTTVNAVRIQLWTAMCAYLAVAIIRKRFCLTESMTTVLQIVSVNAFQKVPLAELFTQNASQENQSRHSNQLILNGF
jgi:hypothetical protein